MQIDPSKKTKLLVLCSGDFPAEVCEYTKTAVKSFKYAYAYTYYVEVPSGIFVKGNMGCIGHPNAKGQALIAESIYETVNKIL
jgi:hypothetical protein